MKTYIICTMILLFSVSNMLPAQDMTTKINHGLLDQIFLQYWIAQRENMRNQIFTQDLVTGCDLVDDLHLASISNAGTNLIAFEAYCCGFNVTVESILNYNIYVHVRGYISYLPVENTLVIYGVTAEGDVVSQNEAARWASVPAGIYEFFKGVCLFNYTITINNMRFGGPILKAPCSLRIGSIFDDGSNIVLQWISTVRLTLTNAQFHSSGTGVPGTYKINSVDVGTTFDGQAFVDYDKIEAAGPNGLWRWSDGRFDNPRLIYGPDQTLYARYKGLHFSDNSAAFANNGQRKFVQSLDGWQHMVYDGIVDGASHVFYENKPPGGAWQFVHAGGPERLNLDVTSGKSPSIDYDVSNDYNGSCVVIAFQEGSQITLALYRLIDGVYAPCTSYQIQTAEPPTADLKPTFAWSALGEFLLLWEGKTGSPGINYVCGRLWGTQTSEPIMDLYPSAHGIISGTNANSTNATISNYKLDTQYGSVFDIAIEQVDQGTINYCYAVFNLPTKVVWFNGTPSPINTATTPRETNPSIVSLDFANGCWIAWSGKQPVRPYWPCVRLYNPITYQSDSYLDFGRRAPSINLAGDAEPVVAWWGTAGSGGAGICQFLANPGSTPKQWTSVLADGPRDIQLCNGPSTSGVFASDLEISTAPYVIETLNSVGSYGLAKTAITPLINSSRGCNIVLNGTTFDYSFGNVTVDGAKIDFVGFPDTLKFNSTANINKALWTNPFLLRENSKCTFFEQISLSDSSLAKSQLRDSGYVDYRVELLDAATHDVLGLIKDTKVQSATCKSYVEGAYCLDPGSLGEKQVQIKITLSTNTKNATYSLTNFHSGSWDTLSSMNSLTELSLQSPLVIKEYALGQNYPNPFNPTTTIHYQIPNAGHVTLKIFDMLGREVAKLVDADKEIGSYAVIFDASRLSSGVYFARFVANSANGKQFMQVKKMILTK